MERNRWYNPRGHKSNGVRRGCKNSPASWVGATELLCEEGALWLHSSPGINPLSLHENTYCTVHPPYIHSEKAQLGRRLAACHFGPGNKRLFGPATTSPFLSSLLSSSSYQPFLHPLFSFPHLFLSSPLISFPLLFPPLLSSSLLSSSHRAHWVYITSFWLLYSIYLFKMSRRCERNKPNILPAVSSSILLPLKLWRLICCDLFLLIQWEAFFFSPPGTAEEKGEEVWLFFAE